MINGLKILSIHAPTRGATCEILKLTPDYFAFNPRSYKRSDNIGVTTSQQMLLSIHAPTRGATIYLSTLFYYLYFQSTLLQEERQEDTIMANIYAFFQSTLLQEERRGSAQYKGWHLLLSIHAPTRGATRICHSYYYNVPVFQSTLLQEERQIGAGFKKHD